MPVEPSPNQCKKKTMALDADSLHMVTDFGTLDASKYTSVHLNNKLDWTLNTVTLYRMGQNRLPTEEMQVSWSAEGHF